MPAKKYIVTLTEAEKEKLREVVNKGKQPAEKRAQALLLTEENYTDGAIAERTGLSCRGLEQLRRRFVEEGFEVTLLGKPRGYKPKALGGAERGTINSVGMQSKTGRQSPPDNTTACGEMENAFPHGDENDKELLRNKVDDIKNEGR